MGKKVFANGMEIAHKAGDAKVTAAFPDVCMSPPPPPAGPIPLPYPNTSFAKDLKNGSTTVKIGGQPIALSDSYYSTSPLGNEAATRNFGGSMLTHTITGKTYFQAHSMNVAVEGKKVCRHLDIMTSNHGSYPGSTPPFPNLEQEDRAKKAIENKKCACCDGPRHSNQPEMHRDEWYEDNINEAYKHEMKGISQGIEAARKKLAGAQSLGPEESAKAAAELAEQQARIDVEKRRLDENIKEYRELSQKAVAKKSCGCPPVAPSPPCDVYYKQPKKGKARKAQHKTVNGTWRKFREAQQSLPPESRIAALRNMEPNDQVNHLTPKSAGGCPVGHKYNQGNLVLDKELCKECKKLEERFTDFQKLG